MNRVMRSRAMAASSVSNGAMHRACALVIGNALRLRHVKMGDIA